MNITKRMWLASTSRRHFLRRSPPFFAALALTACGHSATRKNDQTLAQSQAQPQGQGLSPTPACGDYALTPRQTPGPFYTPNSPQRQSLLTAETVGDRLVVSGQVLTTGCQPIANSLIDVWQTDADGNYDNEGNTLRGHQFTDAEGRYWIETIVPGLYPGRTRHFHIKVQAPNLPVLTTQLYLPDEPLNEGDFLFQPALLLTVEDSSDGKQAQFDFVLG